MLIRLGLLRADKYATYWSDLQYVEASSTQSSKHCIRSPCGNENDEDACSTLRHRVITCTDQKAINLSCDVAAGSAVLVVWVALARWLPPAEHARLARIALVVAGAWALTVLALLCRLGSELGCGKCCDGWRIQRDSLKLQMMPKNTSCTYSLMIVCWYKKGKERVG